MRLPKKLLPTAYIIGALMAVATVVLLVYFLADNYLSGHGSSKAVACRTERANHSVIIQNSRLSSRHVQGVLCDTLTITNADDELRLMAFGEHDHHRPYDDVSERPLKQGQSLTITLDKTGTYEFHDHLHDEVRGSFTVTK